MREGCGDVKSSSRDDYSRIEPPPDHKYELWGRRCCQPSIFRTQPHPSSHDKSLQVANQPARHRRQRVSTFSNQISKNIDWSGRCSRSQVPTRLDFSSTVSGVLKPIVKMLQGSSHIRKLIAALLHQKLATRNPF
jgi:hypothetical protein